MRWFKMPAWKVGPPTLRVLALLLAPVAMSHVIGACAKRQPPDVRREEALAKGTQCPEPDDQSPHKGSLTLLDGGLLEPEHLCLQTGDSLDIESLDPRPRTVCFTRQAPGNKDSPFKGDEVAIRVTSGRNESRTIKQDQRAAGRYDITVLDGVDVPCEGGTEGHGLGTGNGTLEVASGNPNEGPDGGRK
jgi:hypothetical protein